MSVQTIAIESIRRDGGTQSRAAVSQETVAEYAEAMQGGADFDPITCYYDGSELWLADGFHRVAAALTAGRAYIRADVRQGTQRDAVLHSVGANARHGLRRTNADKRRAVETLLRDDEWRCWSNVEIAKRCGVDDKTVGNIRRELEASSEIPSIDTRIGADGRAVPVQSSEKLWGHEYYDEYLALYPKDQDVLFRIGTGDVYIKLWSFWEDDLSQGDACNFSISGRAGDTDLAWKFTNEMANYLVEKYGYVMADLPSEPEWLHKALVKISRNRAAINGIEIVGKGLSSIPAPFKAGDRVLVDGEREGTVRKGHLGRLSVYFEDSGTTHNYDPARVSLLAVPDDVPMTGYSFRAGDRVVTRTGALGTVVKDQMDRLVTVLVDGRTPAVPNTHHASDLRLEEPPSAAAPPDLAPDGSVIEPGSAGDHAGFRVGDRVLVTSSGRVGTVTKDAPRGVVNVRVQYDSSPQITMHDPRKVELLTDERQTTIDDAPRPAAPVPQSSIASSIEQLHSAIVAHERLSPMARNTALDLINDLRAALVSVLAEAVR